MKVAVDPLRKKSRWKQACLCAVSDGIPSRSFYVALAVGTVLNLINQGDALVGSGLDQLAEADFDILRSLCSLHLRRGFPPVKNARRTRDHRG
jgi:hypothetical protein